MLDKMESSRYVSYLYFDGNVRNLTICRIPEQFVESFKAICVEGKILDNLLQALKLLVKTERETLYRLFIQLNFKALSVKGKRASLQIIQALYTLFITHIAGNKNQTNDVNFQHFGPMVTKTITCKTVQKDS